MTDGSTYTIAIGHLSFNSLDTTLLTFNKAHTAYDIPIAIRDESGTEAVWNLMNIGNITADTGKFLTVKCTDLTSWYYPLHKSDDDGLVDGHIKDSLGIMVFQVPDIGEFIVIHGADTLQRMFDSDGKHCEWGTAGGSVTDWTVYGDLSVANNAMSGGNIIADGVIQVGGIICPEDYDIAAPSIYADSCVNALIFTDRTPYYSGDALKELQKIKGKDGKIDHASLPDFARHINTYKNKKGKTVSDTGRDLGATITLLTIAVQQLSARCDSLEKKVKEKAGTPQGSAPIAPIGGALAIGIIGAAILMGKKRKTEPKSENKL
jgi:hypothetical protein